MSLQIAIADLYGIFNIAKIPIKPKDKSSQSRKLAGHSKNNRKAICETQG